MLQTSHVLICLLHISITQLNKLFRQGGLNWRHNTNSFQIVVFVTTNILFFRYQFVGFNFHDMKFHTFLVCQFVITSQHHHGYMYFNSYSFLHMANLELLITHLVSEEAFFYNLRGIGLKLQIPSLLANISLFGMAAMPIPLWFGDCFHVNSLA